MDDVVEEDAPLFDDFSHQSCYVFRPSETAPPDDERPAKRVKLSKQEPIVNDDRWPRLCAGKESLESADERQTTFQRLWKEQEFRIHNVTHQVDQSALQDLIEYVCREDDQSQERLRTALLVSRSDSSVQEHLIQELENHQDDTSHYVMIRLSSNQAPNLQTALKNIIRTTIVTKGGPNGYSTHITANKRLIPMNFDLELLQKYVDKNKLHRVVISMLNVETFDLAVLSELLSNLSSWIDRIKISVVLGLATTVELFESRLSTSTIKVLDAEAFELHGEVDPPYRVFDAVQNNSETSLFVGPTMINNLADMTQDQGESSTSLIRVLKYAYMSHFFANPLSRLLSEAEIEKKHQPILCAAIRQTDSFRGHCNTVLAKPPQHQKLQKLVGDDSFLLQEAQIAIQDGQARMRQTVKAFQIFHQLYRHLEVSPISSFELEAQLYSEQPTFSSSDFLDVIVSPIRQLSPRSLLNLVDQPWLDVLVTVEEGSKSIESLERLRESLKSLLSTENATTVPATSHNHISKSATKTLQSPKNRQADYTTITSAFISLLEEYFIQHTISPTSLFLHEAFVFNLKSPLATTMVPRPRFALERALERPGDYLSCECCSHNGAGNPTDQEDDAETKVAKFPPPTSVLCTLLNEAGVVINVKDLWDAFRERIMPTRWTSSNKIPQTNGNGDTDDMNDNDMTDEDHASIEDENDADSAGEEESQHGTNDVDQKGKGMNERLAMALFYRSLAELKMMGLVKQSKRKPGVECITKTNWKGL